jgi:iron complex outermembrane receptor protein
MTPFTNLQLRSSLGILHDRFTEFDDPSDPRAKDRHLAFVSPYTTSTSVEYTFGLLSLGNMTARADWSTRSQQFFDSPNSDGLKAGKRGLLDARLALLLEDGMTEIALFGKNLTDREYLVSGVDFSASFGNQIRFVGPPRTYGLEVRRRF